MSEKKCPTETELLSFVDADAPPEQLARVEKHLEECGSCAKRAMTLSTLVQDLSAALEQQPLDVADHVASVMRRLDAPPMAPGWSRFVRWGGGLAVAAASLLLVAKLRAPHELRGEEELVARGGAVEASLSRHVGVQLYAQGQSLTALGSGSRVTRSTPLTAGLRNAGSERAYLLLFAVDSRQEVHWLAPQYTSEGEDPEATPIAASAGERLLPSVAVFDDLAPGPLRVVAVLARSPLRVSDVEALPPSELTAERLLERLPRAEIRQFLLEAE
jgi:Putative zinc-finger